ncbi:MAG: alpha-glucosidase [Treponema sp.]|nr:alpha-glucosidase [Candidatus Treponema caballi]
MERTEWYKNAVVYQIYPFSYMDANNDGWGDIAGIISKLDYLKELGITAIWFSPLYKSPDCDYGYDIADYRDIDPKFGTLDEFKVMLKECHVRGIKVVMDMVLNHSSTEHWWFQEALRDKNSPYRDYYIIREGKKKSGKVYPPTNWDSTFTGSAWERIKDTDEYYLHMFCVEQADLNWENEKVRQECADIFNFWLDMGVDGFRLDVFNMWSKEYPLRDGKKKVSGTGQEFVVDGPRMHEFLHEMYEKSWSKYDCYTVGESFDPHEEDAKRYVAKESQELDTIFNFAHFSSDNKAGLKYFKKRFDLPAFKQGLFGPQMKNFETGWNTLVLENHDNPRSVSRFGIDTKKFRYEAATFLPTITFLGFGTPFIYQGEEIGMTNTVLKSIDDCMDPVSHFVYNLMKHKGIPGFIALNLVRYGSRDHARVPMQWNDSVNGGFNTGAKPWQCPNTKENIAEINAEKDMKSDRSVFRFYQKVIALKKDERAAVYGKPELFAADDKQIVSFTRTLEDGSGLFVFGNFSNKNAKYVLSAELAARAKEEVLSNYDTHMVNGGTYTLRPYEVLVFKF